MQSASSLAFFALANLAMLCSAQFPAWPKAINTTTVSKTIVITGTVDAKNARFIAASNIGNGGQGEGQKAIFLLKKGATLRNAIIGSPAADGVHCEDSCNIESVWWEDVGEDAATFRSTDKNAVFKVTGGGAKEASDKVFQHNGGGTVYIKNFQVYNFGKLYKSCGNCKVQYKRKAVLDTIKATGSGKDIVAINKVYGDQAQLSNIQVSSACKVICELFDGNNSGGSKDPTSLKKYLPGQSGDGTYCVYSASAVKVV
uniref:Probable pectate lyase F n=1 Tax=Radopholus similis TaxID=46012 RepID=A0A6C0VW14_RADSI|nr:pectate lyase 4 [Radopholus similis]